MKRLERCFIVTKTDNTPSFYQHIRKHLHDVCDEIINPTIGPSIPTWLSLTDELRRVMPSASLRMFNRMLSQDRGVVEKRAAAFLFKQLFYDSSVDIVTPYFPADMLIRFALKINSGDYSSSHVSNLVYN